MVQVHVIAKYGSKIMPVCAKVQENVKQTIQNMTGITVSRVDVIVAGLEEMCIRDRVLADIGKVAFHRVGNVDFGKARCV